MNSIEKEVLMPPVPGSTPRNKASLRCNGLLYTHINSL